MSKARFFALLWLLAPPQPGCGDTESDAVPDAAHHDASADAAPDAEAPSPFERALSDFCRGHERDVEARIDATLPTLTLEQKVSLMHGDSGLPLHGTWTTGSIPDAGIAGFRMLDGPRGLSRFSRMDGTAFPVAMARGATWDPELEREVGREIAAELRVAGADTLLAPTVNVLRHPRWGRAQETYGEDPFHLGVLGTGFVQGAQEHTLAVVKHYAVNSIENTRMRVDVQVDEQTLREVYLPHFRAIVRDAQPAGIMTAYNRINGDWASESTHLIRDILHQDWHYPGFTVSDWSQGTHDTHNAIRAGLDLEMPVPQVYGPPLVQAVGEGSVDGGLIDEAVRRLLRAQWCFAERIQAPPASETLRPEALALAQRVATRGAVLLENRGVLPIERSAAPSIVVVGELASAENTGDGGSSAVRSAEVVSILEGLQAAAGQSTITHLSTLDQDAHGRVSDADLVVAVVGYTADDEGEGQVAAGDRATLALRDAHVALLQELAALNERVVVVVVTGSAFVTEGWGDQVEGIVVAWYAGARGGDAIAALLFGDENFSGRLPLSFAAREADLPPFDNVSDQVSYGPLHGYRHLNAAGTAALYPFGFGLSYTSFSHTQITAEHPESAQELGHLKVDARVENTGGVAGRDTLQVYVSAPTLDGSTHEPARLRGFAQVALDAGEAADVTIQVPVSELQRYDPALGRWRLVPGDYTLRVGSDAESFDAEFTFTLGG